MNTLEDRIRAAVVQTAEEIAPGSIRPLSLPDQVPSGRRTRAGRAPKAGRGSARWPRVLIPIAAARAHAARPGTGTDVLWASASGSTLIVSNASTVGVLAGGQFTPLPDAPDVGIMSAW
jgi:hypothetical protein